MRRLSLFQSRKSETRRSKVAIDATLAGDDCDGDAGCRRAKELSSRLASEARDGAAELLVAVAARRVDCAAGAGACAPGQRVD